MEHKFFWKDRAFLKTMLSVALPVSVQYLITTSVNMADTVMISSLGGAEIAAVGLVNQFVFFFMVSSYGIANAGAVFFSQYFGNRDMTNVRRFLSITIQLTVLLSLLFTTVSFFRPEMIMRILIPDQGVIQLGAEYLRIISLTFIMSSVSLCFNTVLRSSNRATEPLGVSIVAFFTNVFFNYLFIFGKFGFPALGIVGAAIGTLIARIVEILLLIVLIYWQRPGKEDIRPIELLLWHSDRLKSFFSIALPIILSETLWSLGQLLFAMAYARIGKDATASIQLTTTIQNVFFIIVNSLGAAAAVLIGHSLGGEKKDQAQRQARYFIQLTVMSGVLSALILIGLPDLLLKIYGNLEPHIYDTAVNLLMIRGVFILFRFLNGMLIVGIFRAGGETKLPFIMELLTMWVFAIPMSFFGVLVLQWPIELIFTIVSLEEFIKVFLMIPLYRKKRWLNNITNEEAA